MLILKKPGTRVAPFHTPRHLEPHSLAPFISRLIGQSCLRCRHAGGSWPVSPCLTVYPYIHEVPNGLLAELPGSVGSNSSDTGSVGLSRNSCCAAPNEPMMVPAMTCLLTSCCLPPPMPSIITPFSQTQHSVVVFRGRAGMAPTTQPAHPIVARFSHRLTVHGGRASLVPAAYIPCSAQPICLKGGTRLVPVPSWDQ